MKRCPQDSARGRSRRGVLLLVVLSLLVLFSLVAVTFVLVAGQYRKSSRSATRSEQYGDDPQKQIDEVFAQVVRDTTNTNSVLQFHSLLNDLYGIDGVKGTVSGATAVSPTGAGVTSTQLVDLTLSSATNLPGSSYPNSTQYAMPGYFNGCVLTMVDGPAANMSMRVVGWMTSGGGYTVRVVLPDGFNGSNLPTNIVPSGGTQNYVINGRPFNGTGFGFDNTLVASAATAPTLLAAKTQSTPTSVMLKGSPAQLYYALMPNARSFPNSTPLARSLPYNAAYPIFWGPRRRGRG